LQEYLRVFKPFDIDDIRKHLILMGDLSADCGACKELGLDMATAKSCPHCGAVFKYATSRRLENNPGERFSWAKRTQERRPDLILIDYTDYTKLLGQKKARDFFA
jgi:hypothetical protein